MNSPIEHKRHSLAHLLAAAVTTLFPKAQITIGPAIENGFYYDIDFSGAFSAGTTSTDTLPDGRTTLSEEDFPAIESKMRDILDIWSKAPSAPQGFIEKKVSPEDARIFFADNPYKLELIEEITSKGDDITLYVSGDGTPFAFTDLCRGGHIENPAHIDPQSFKLTKLAGAYWRGNEKNNMLTRIYGVAFDTKIELDTYLTQQEEAKKRDHRKLGQELDLFEFDELIGKGLPLWLPKGNIIKEELENWAKEIEKEWGYDRVTTPVITKENLFYTSGHLPMYKDSMYAPLDIEGENYFIKPMNCPFHHRVFAARPKSYRDLPLRLAEYGWCHRYEDSGSLFGLMRVRGMQMNDAHIYVALEDAVDEFVRVIKLHEYYYKTLGITDYEMELALRDPNKMDKYHGDESDWKLAEQMTIDAMEKSGVPYKIVHEGAAFYGPKMDFQIKSSIGRSFTASTNQLDLYMGKKFELEYTDKDGSKKVPAIIHRAPLGTHERFIGFLIEHFGGAFPFWLSPVQVKVIPIGERQLAYADTVFKALKGAHIRVEIDDSNESLGKKVRNAKTSKIPFSIVIGDKEMESGLFNLEGRSEKIEGKNLADTISYFETLIRDRKL